MGAIAFCGESPSQLSGALIQFGDQSRPSQGNSSPSKESFLTLPARRSSEKPQKILKVVSMPGGDFLDGLVAFQSGLEIAAGTSHIWNIHGGSRLVLSLSLYTPSRRP